MGRRIGVRTHGSGAARTRRWAVWWRAGFAAAVAVGCGGGEERATTAGGGTDERAVVASAGAEAGETSSKDDTPDEPTGSADVPDREGTADDPLPPGPASNPAPVAAAPELEVALTLSEGRTEPTARCAPPRHEGWTGSPGCARRGRAWASVPAEHGRCVTSADCTVVVAGHCRHVALSAGAAASERYATPACGPPNAGACMPGWNDDGRRPEAICLAGCCTLHGTRGGRPRKELVHDDLASRVETSVRACLDDVGARPSTRVSWAVDLAYGGGGTTIEAPETAATPEPFVRCLTTDLPGRLPPNMVGDRWDVRIDVAAAE